MQGADDDGVSKDRYVRYLRASFFFSIVVLKTYNAFVIYFYAMKKIPNGYNTAISIFSLLTSRRAK